MLSEMTHLLALLFFFKASPAVAAIPAERIQAAAAYSSSHGGHAFLIMQNGKVLYESYANGHSRGAPHRIYSGTKAFWGLAALAADKDGLVSLDEPVSNTITEWKDDTRRSQITVRQLLDFSSGLAPMFGLHENTFKDRTAAALKAPVAGTPGGSFIYGPASLQVWHEVLARKLRDKGQTPTRYLERKVLGAVSLGPQRYLPDQKGAPLLASGFMLTARQWAGLGHWVLKHKDVQATLKGSANPAFGFGFWNNKATSSTAHEVDVESMLDRPWASQSWRGACLSRVAPADMLACIGSYGQRLYIIPSQKLVIVRLAQDKKPDDAQMLKLLFSKGS